MCPEKRALRASEIAIDLDSNLADAFAYTGLIKLHLGRAEETESAVFEAIRRSPRDPTIPNWHFWNGAAELYLNRIDRALERLRKSTLINPNLGYAWRFLASALAWVITGFAGHVRGMPLDPSAADHSAAKPTGCASGSRQPYSITSSLRASRAAAISMPSALAALRLRTNWNLVARSSGMSPGFAPLRILSTRAAARRNIWENLTP
jgi:tetratricopeptide (TPR) repeat protein